MPFTVSLRNEVVERARPPYTSLILFGSFARGDARPDSDIDILQVTNAQCPSYSADRYTFSCYTRQHLNTLAKARSLFAFHLATEGATIQGDPTPLAEIVRAVPFPDLRSTKEGVLLTMPLLDVGPSAYAARSKRYSRLAKHLLRSWAYSEVISIGSPTFSMTAVAQRLGDPRLSDQRIWTGEEQSYANYREVVCILEEMTGTLVRNPAGSPEAYLVNVFGLRDTPIALGLRLLCPDDFLPPYESVALSSGMP